MSKTATELNEVFSAPSIKDEDRNAGHSGGGSGRNRPRAKVSGSQGPVISAAIGLGAGLVLGGIGLMGLLGDDSALDRLRGEEVVVAQAPQVVAGEGTVIVTLPDADGNGVADAMQPGEVIAPAEKPVTVDVTLPDTDGNGIADMFEMPVKAPEPEPAPEPEAKPEVPARPASYAIRPGDTLAEISAETGVSVDALAKANSIQNPNMIYAGSALLIPVE